MTLAKNGTVPAAVPAGTDIAASHPNGKPQVAVATRNTGTRNRDGPEARLATGATRPKAYAQIVGWGYVVPEKIVTNFDLEKIVETSDEWIRNNTGIVHRHVVVDDQETSATLGVQGRPQCPESGQGAPPESRSHHLCDQYPDPFLSLHRQPDPGQPRGHTRRGFRSQLCLFRLRIWPEHGPGLPLLPGMPNMSSWWVQRS